MAINFYPSNHILPKQGGIVLSNLHVITKL